MDTHSLRMLLNAQFRFGDYPCDNVDPENKAFFDEMFRMEPMDRIEAFMGLTAEVRTQYWSYWMDVRHKL